MIKKLSAQLPRQYKKTAKRNIINYARAVINNFGPVEDTNDFVNKMKLLREQDELNEIKKQYAPRMDLMVSRVI